MFSDDDQKSVLQTVEILRKQVVGIQFTEFHNYGHFCFDDMKTVEFPELLNHILK
jgi:hypothetical protein